MEKTVIQFLAANINAIILVFFAVAMTGLAILARAAVRIPRQLRYVLDVIVDEVKDLRREEDNLAMLHALRQYLAAADPVRRGQLQGRIIESNRWKPDIASEGTRRFAAVLGVFGELFPLLGILGTVCAMAAKGLMGGDPELAFAGVVKLFETAVTSTIYGIVCAVIFLPLFQWVGAKLESGYRQADEIRAWIAQMEREVARVNASCAAN